MPRFEPFTGLRYDPSIPLDAVVAPPYDVVGPKERARLASRHRANSIHVELPADDTRSSQDKYQAAARLLRSWLEEGLLRRDETPSMYSYRMVEPSGATTTGVIGALACEPRGGDVLPHEQTIPKDMSDRLQLLRACRANLSPIWGLSLTEGLSKTYEQLGPPEREATDDDGVLHRLWVIEDPATIESVTLGVAESPVVIADGHHRYDTARAYRAECRAAAGDAPGDYDLVMALVVELAEDQLSVGAIHRVLKGVPSTPDVPEGFERWFSTERVGDAREEIVGGLVDSATLTLVTRSGAWALSARPEAFAAAESDLDSSLVGLALEDLRDNTTAFDPDWRHALATVARGEADAALLLRPVSVAQISSWAHARRRMPPKSTYFRPKPRTGMVFRPVED